jgi:nicotinamidase-related amidase
MIVDMETKHTSKTVVIVVDLLNDFFKEGVLASRRTELTQAVNNLVSFARDKLIPIIWVRQEFASDLSDAFSEMRKKRIAVTISGTNGCLLLPELDYRPSSDHLIIKKRYSAFYGTELDNLLAKLNPTNLIIAGINTHACVRMTAIDAYQRDYEVVLAKECIASYDVAHHEVTLRYMDGKIAQILSNTEIFDLI